MGALNQKATRRERGQDYYDYRRSEKSPGMDGAGHKASVPNGANSARRPSAYDWFRGGLAVFGVVCVNLSQKSVVPIRLL